MEKAKDTLGEDYDVWVAEKALLEDGYSKKLISFRKEYEKKHERLQNKYFKTGSGSKDSLSKLVWLGKVNYVYPQINKILKPAEDNKEEEKVIEVITYKLNFPNKPKEFNLKI